MTATKAPSAVQVLYSCTGVLIYKYYPIFAQNVLMVAMALAVYRTVLVCQNKSLLPVTMLMELVAVCQDTTDQTVN